jgi:hypothetical protein
MSLVATGVNGATQSTVVALFKSPNPIYSAWNRHPLSSAFSPRVASVASPASATAPPASVLPHPAGVSAVQVYRVMNRSGN